METNFIFDERGEISDKFLVWLANYRPKTREEVLYLYSDVLPGAIDGGVQIAENELYHKIVVSAPDSTGRIVMRSVTLNHNLWWPFAPSIRLLTDHVNNIYTIAAFGDEVLSIYGYFGQWPIDAGESYYGLPVYWVGDIKYAISFSEGDSNNVFRDVVAENLTGVATDKDYEEALTQYGRGLIGGYDLVERRIDGPSGPIYAYALGVKKC